MKQFALTLLITLLVGCAGLYTNTVTITKVADSALRELAALHAQGKIDTNTDKRIGDAVAVYNKACGVAEDALIAYKAGGSKDTYVAMLEAVRGSVKGLLDLLAPYILTSKTVELNTALSKATAL